MRLVLQLVGVNGWGTALALLGLMLAACGDDDGGGDGGLTPLDDGGELEAPAPPAAPRDVESPVLTPCPPGWEEQIDEYGIAVCEPFPGGRGTPCPVDQARFVGSGTCTPVGPRCPVGAFAPDLPSDTPIVYVLAGATGGDGSMTSPHGTLRDAVTAAPTGAVVAVGRGDYEDGIRVQRDLTIWGACTADTVVRGTPAPGRYVLSVDSPARATVRALRVGPASTRGFGTTGTLVLEDVVVDRTTRQGIAVEDSGRLEAARVVVRDMRFGPVPGEGGNQLGFGVQVFPDAMMTMRESVVEASQSAAVAIAGSATFADVSIDDTRCTGTGVAAVYVDMGGQATLSRTAVERSCAAGVLLLGEGSGVVLEDFMLRDGVPLGDAGFGIAAPLVGDGANRSIEGRRGSIVGFTPSGVASNVGSVDLQDVVVRDTTPRADGNFGVAVNIADTPLTGSRLHLARSHGAGIAVFEGSADLQDVAVSDIRPSAGLSLFGAGLAIHESTADVRGLRTEHTTGLGVQVLESSLSLSDAVILDVLAAADRSLGHGVSVGRGPADTRSERGSRADLVRVRVERYREVGLSAGSAGSVLTAEDVVVREGLGRELDGLFGHGAGAQGGAAIELRRAVLEDNRYLGFSAHLDGSTGLLEDVVIRDTRGMADGRWGRGLQAEGDGVVVEVTRALLERNREFGAAVVTGATLRVQDVCIVDTLARDCADSTCSDTPAGHGILVFGDPVAAELDARRLSVEGSALCGIVNGPGTSVFQFQHSRVSGNVIGLCNLNDQPTIELIDGIVFEDNEVPVQSTEFDVGNIPEPMGTAP